MGVGYILALFAMQPLKHNLSEKFELYLNLDKVNSFHQCSNFDVQILIFYIFLQMFDIRFCSAFESV